MITSSLARRAGQLITRWETVLVVLIIGVGVWSTSLSPYFLDLENLLALATPFIATGILALALACVVIGGEIDISLASTLAVSAVVFAEAWQGGTNIWIACLIALAVGTSLGLVNGLLVGLLDLPSLAITLGTLAGYQGLATVILGSEGGITGFPDSFTQLGIGYIGSSFFPIALFVFLVIALILALVLHGTRFGRYVFAIGLNREAARFSGVPVTRVRVTLFALAGFLSGIASLIYAASFSVRGDAGEGALLDVVAIVVLGGISIFGGVGTVAGAVLAFILVAMVRNGMGLANIGGETQSIVVGSLLLAAIVVANVTRGLNERKSRGPRAAHRGDAHEQQTPISRIAG